MKQLGKIPNFINRIMYVWNYIWSLNELNIKHCIEIIILKYRE